MWDNFDLVELKVTFGHLLHLWFSKYNFQNAALSTLMNIFQSNILYVFPVTIDRKVTCWKFEAYINVITKIK